MAIEFLREPPEDNPAKPQRDLAQAHHDGKSDLVWGNTSTNATAIWLMNGTARLSGAGLPAGPTWFIANPQ